MNPIQKIYEDMRPNKSLADKRVVFLESEKFDVLAKFEGCNFDGLEMTYQEIEDLVWYLKAVQKMMPDAVSMP